MATVILPCECRHVFQDDYYGQGKRVHNRTRPKEVNRNYYRCTVCGKEKEVANKDLTSI